MTFWNLREKIYLLDFLPEQLLAILIQSGIELFWFFFNYILTAKPILLCVL